MNGFNRIKVGRQAFVILLGLFLLFGCSRISYKPTKSFPAPAPENSQITINLNAKGEFFVVDQNGEAVPPECIPFSSLVEASNVKDGDWMKVHGSYTLYKIKENGKVWICDGNYECLEGRFESKSDTMVFSVNFDGEDLVMRDAQGKGGTRKELVKFASLVQEAGLTKKVELSTVSMFTVYEIRGSIKYASCSPNNICYCLCLNPATRRVTRCVNGRCP